MFRCVPHVFGNEEANAADPSTLTPLWGCFSVSDSHNFITGLVTLGCSGLVIDTFMILHGLFK